MSGASLLLPRALAGCSSPAEPESDLPRLPVDPGGRWWLSGNFAPVEDEVELFDLEVIGSIPAELDGLFLRNGPNPVTGESSSWLFGDAMLHGLRIERGVATWYRNRYVDTHVYRVRRENASASTLGANLANTSIAQHGGRTFALYENGLPYEIDPRDLSTLGEHTFGDRLRGPMTAHPKIDPITNEMVFIGYSPFEPYLVVHFVDPEGTLERSVPIDLPGARMMHDMAITENYVILLDLPLRFDIGLIQDTGFPFAWSPELGARLGVLPRAAVDASELRWFDVDTCFVFHTFNAFERGSELVLHACRHEKIWVDGPHDETSHPYAWRFTMDLEQGSLTEEQLDDRMIEFPRIDARRTGRPHTMGYALRFAPPGPGLPKFPYSLVSQNFESGAIAEYTFQEGMQPDEAVFAPDPSSTGEDEGWLLTMVFDEARRGSEMMVFDASTVTIGPIARVRLPRRVPYGFHGAWLPSGG